MAGSTFCEYIFGTNFLQKCKWILKRKTLEVLPTIVLLIKCTLNVFKTQKYFSENTFNYFKNAFKNPNTTMKLMIIKWIHRFLFCFFFFFLIKIQAKRLDPSTKFSINRNRSKGRCLTLAFPMKFPCVCFI